MMRVFMQCRALIVDCFREALDRKLFWVMVGISVMIAVAMACVGFDASGVNILFGQWHFKTDMFAPGHPEGRALIGALLTKYIGDIYIGWIGIIIALVATSGIFPSLLERGAVDGILAKPMSRPMLFLGKYVGSMSFVAIQAAVFVILTLLVAGFRWHYWSWAYLWCIPLIVILFSYVYAFCALFGVITRNAMASLLLTMIAWIGIFIPQAAYETLVNMPAMTKNQVHIDEKWMRLSAAAKWIVPKTGDITYIAGNLVGAAMATEVVAGSPEDPEEPNPILKGDRKATIEAERQLSDVNLFKSIGSSLLFEAMIVAIAMWKFSRRDY